MKASSIRSEGGLIPADLLEAIAAAEAEGQGPGDFGLPRTARLADEVALAWGDARAYYEALQRRLQRLPEGDPATTVTREQWVIPLLGSLGYERLLYQPRAAQVDGSTFAISHRAGPDEEALAVHIEGCRTDLDRRPPTGRPRLSPHALVQEYLNRTEHLWSLVSNGYRLRLLRDSALMSRPAYLEFDLQQMLEGELFADFALFFRLVHRTRLPHTLEDASECWLERYYTQALEQGGRVDRYGQRCPEVRAILLCGRDNPIDGAVLEVLIRKAMDIRKTLGIAVPVPVESESVVEAVLRSLFLRSEAAVDRQLSLFEVGELGIEGMHQQWDQAVDRERVSRTRFAQHAIKPEEVARELEEADAVLGDPDAVERFVRAACQRLGAPLRPASSGWQLDLQLLPEGLRERLGSADEWRITFQSPPAEGTTYVGRNHALTSALAEHLLGQALVPEEETPPAARSAVIRTDAVGRRTTLILLRLRHLLRTPGSGTSLAEETVVQGFSGRPGSMEWVSEADSLELLLQAQPRANVGPNERGEWLNEVLPWLDDLQPDLARLAHERAELLREAHRRVRKITREDRLIIEPQLPADVLGIYVLLPVPA